MAFANPIIPGFHPDPSICRVGRDYYLANSSFEYFPGVPLFHSRDLVNWRPIGHALTRPSQLSLDGCRPSGGIFAPTLRYHDGLFYLVTTNVSGGGNFLVTAEDPAGPWSEPIWLDEDGFDPSLFFDDDGRIYYARRGHDSIVQTEYDPAGRKLIGPPRPIWDGGQANWPEGPHLFKRDGMYVLIAAEGGTHRGHMETCARSRSPQGPFEPCPHNPILTSRDDSGNPIQAAGHADLVETPDGQWWAVFLGIRQVGAAFFRYHHLGRETFLAPVEWTDDGWPCIVAPEMESARGPDLPEHPWPGEPMRDDFDEPRLRPQWNFLRTPRDQDWSLTDRPGWLRLNGSARTLDEIASPAFVGRRQQHLHCRAETRMEFAAVRDGDEAGLTILANADHHYDLFVTRLDGRRQLQLRRRVGDLSAIAAGVALPDGPVRLRVLAEPTRYEFAMAVGDGPMTPLASAQTRYLSSEVAGGFTGVYIGLYATGNGRLAGAPAEFDWFDYEPDPDRTTPRRASQAVESADATRA